MRDAETTLGIISERGRKHLHLEDVYRRLYNPDLYLRAYGRIYRNDGAMTRGATEETVDGMSLKKIRGITELLKFERYRWTPVRRTYIEKKGSTKKRPLGIPTWSDKLLQEVMRSILNAFYEPQFSDHSHGFRPERGCHTALAEVQHNWTGTKWFIEGDIKGCFDNIDHSVLLSILREKIHDNRFLTLVEGLLKAGYLEDWRYHQTYSGTPQGGVASPILANIYLDRLDRFVEDTLIPEFTKGTKRRSNPEWFRWHKKVLKAKASGQTEAEAEARKVLRTIPQGIYHGDDYKRLRYIRYADDFLLGLSGTREDAEEIKARIATFLRDHLKLEMSQEKTLISHASEEPARFLGYEIVAMRSDERPSINGHISLRIPSNVLAEKCSRYMKSGRPVHPTYLIDNSDFSIVAQYGQEYRGIVQYYGLASNVAWLNRLHWVMRTSLLKTLANKHKSSVIKVAQRYASKAVTEHGLRRCIAVVIKREGKHPLVAQFGGIPLKRNRRAILDDAVQTHSYNGRTEILEKLLADRCELCGSTEDVEVHHVRKLADLMARGEGDIPSWRRIMIARKRKTLVVCRACHNLIHAGKPTRKRMATE
jgi:group II intron reverse transcriptase/maturase